MPDRISNRYGLTISSELKYEKFATETTEKRFKNKLICLSVHSRCSLWLKLGGKRFGNKIQDQKKLLPGCASTDAHIQEPTGDGGSE